MSETLFGNDSVDYGLVSTPVCSLGLIYGATLLRVYLRVDYGSAAGRRLIKRELSNLGVGLIWFRVDDIY